MANNWNIPSWLEKAVRARDKTCVYCGTEFTPARVSMKSAASWEHIINNVKIITEENIALCCCSCNASKGQNQLSIWLQSDYCKERGITPDTVAPIVKRAIANGQKKSCITGCYTRSKTLRQRAFLVGISSL